MESFNFFSQAFNIEKSFLKFKALSLSSFHIKDRERKSSKPKTKIMSLALLWLIWEGVYSLTLYTYVYNDIKKILGTHQYIHSHLHKFHF